MRFVLVIVIVCLSGCLGAAKTSKKSIKNQEVVLKRAHKGKSHPNAIIAIEIVDPKEEKSGKNSKRTIDGSLGYGYQDSYSPPRYEVYKYSQRDIPPFQGANNFFGSQGIHAHNYDVQKSISYQLPQQQFYQPGTTLFSTVNSQGHAGGLTTYLPQEPQVPVIILRVLPSQLNDPSAILHPRLPQDHPLASTINSIDVQSLLANYVQNLLQRQYVQPQKQYAEQPQLYKQQQQQYEQPQQQYEQPQQQYEQPQQQYVQPQQQEQLLTYENYPKDSHTQVIFKKPEPTNQPETKTIQIQLPSDGSYSGVEVETPDMHYSYGDQNYQNNDYYYQPQEQYQDQDYQQQNYYQYSNNEQAYQEAPQVESTTPYNYHAHQKRSKKPKIEDIKLKPIKAAED